MSIKFRAISTLVLLLTTTCVFAENWPAWRGADGKGISQETSLPQKWSATQNIRWKVSLPDIGNSTPVIWNDHVFLTQALDGGKRRALIAFDRKSGKQLWQREVLCDVAETSHKQNPPCSSSAVTDGKSVFAHFASGGVVAYDFSGNQLWHKKFGPVLHRWGNGGSPVIYKNTLIVMQGPGQPTFLAALDKQNGNIVWKSDEVSINSPIFGSWSTPVLLNVGDHDELILPLPGEKIASTGWIKGYNPATGKMLWQCDGLGNEIYTMPIVGPNNKFVVGVSGHKGPIMAVKTGGTGDVTATHRMWRTTEKMPQRIGSGVYHDGHIYLSDANGIAECLDAQTGSVVWKERLGGNLWGSVLLADGKLHVSNLEGDTFVIAASPKYKLIAKNSLAEPIYSAIAVSQGNLFVRTHQHLYCIGE